MWALAENTPLLFLPGWLEWGGDGVGLETLLNCRADTWEWILDSSVNTDQPGCSSHPPGSSQECHVNVVWSPQKDPFCPQSRAQTHPTGAAPAIAFEAVIQFSKEPHHLNRYLFSMPLVIYVNSQKNNTPWLNLPEKLYSGYLAYSIILFSSQKINSYLYMVEFTSILNWQWYLSLTGY